MAVAFAGKNPFAGGAAYCASKAGLNAFSEALMQELRDDDIRARYVMPGSVATGFFERRQKTKRRRLENPVPTKVADVVVNLPSATIRGASPEPRRAAALEAERSMGLGLGMCQSRFDR